MENLLEQIKLQHHNQNFWYPFIERPVYEVNAGEYVIS